MSKPGVLHLEIYRGDDFDLPFRFWTSTAKTEHSDTTDWTFAAQIRKARGADIQIDIECDTSELTDPDDPKLWLRIDHLTTRDIEFDTSKWDLEIVDENGKVRTYAAGSVFVSGDYTEPES